jgi:hypothetical protein
VTIAAIDDDSYDDNDTPEMSPEVAAKVALLYDKDDPRHPDAWQRNIFCS